jgi:NAD-dependent deacetylase
MIAGDFQERIKRLQDLIDNSTRIVFFWWAGVSTESWVPDFRSKDWLYNQHDVKFDGYQPEYLLSHSCLYNEPKVFFEYYRQKLDCRWIQPNITHKKLAELEKKWKLTSVITQNIDGLHQKAWSKKVLEVHGTTQRVYCDRCGKFYDPNILFTDRRAIPQCDCWGMLRPDVTLYEEQLPAAARRQAMYDLKDSDLLVIWWTSLMVYPANALIQYYWWNHVVIINKDSTSQDRYASLVFHENLGDVFRVLKFRK